MTTTVGVQQFDASGTVTFDSRTAVGGVVGDFREYAAGFSGETVSYPQWAGYSAMLLRYGSSITLSVSGGYPVVTVSSDANARSYVLLVY